MERADERISKEASRESFPDVLVGQGDDSNGDEDDSSTDNRKSAPSEVLLPSRRKSKHSQPIWATQLWAMYKKDFVIRKWKRNYVTALLEIFVFYIPLFYMRGDSEDGAEWDGPATYPVNKPFTLISFRQDAPDELTEISRIAYAPKTVYTQTVVLNAFKHANPTPTFRGFEKPSDVMAFYKENKSWSIDLAIEFDKETAKGSRPDLLSYTLRFDSDLYDFATKKRFSKASLYGSPRSQRISDEETSLLFPGMNSMFRSHLEFFDLLKGVSSDLVIEPRMKPFPTPRYATGKRMASAAMNVPSIFAFGCIPFVLNFTSLIIRDKHSRIKELLRMMGLSDFVYWTNQFLVGFTTMFILITLAWLSLCFPIVGDEVYPNSDPGVILLIFILVGIGQVLLNLLIAAIVNSPILGGIMALLAYLLQLLVVWMMDPPLRTEAYFQIGAWKKILSSCLPVTAFCWAGKLIAFWEQDGVGVQWTNLAKIAQPGDNITLLHVISMVLFSYVVFVSLTLYLDAIVPWQPGIPKHPLFPLKRSYWFYPNEHRDLTETDVESPDIAEENRGMFERLPGQRDRAVIRMRHVTHIFAGAKKRAVDDLSLTLYRNQISVILGHNGAGKTTTMSILTGLFPPTSGDILINGYSVRSQTAKARRGIGLCPQHNVIFDDLTVEEHLNFFSEIKGYPERDGEAEINNLLQRFDLEAKRTTLSANLAGGMKRKLCLANAMVGGSDILILDEVTAGMDPQARRAVWTVLQEARRTRTILMTTHYMEEADVLGDRIAFLARGRLKCAGSPMFLKKKFETGYNMRCATTDGNVNVLEILNRVQGILGYNQARLTSKIGREFIINLGFPKTSDLMTMFRDLEDNKEALGIASLGVSVTTMEDVFLKVGELDLDLGKSDEISQRRMEGFPKFDRITGIRLVFGQFCALFIKRYHMMKRDWMLPLFIFVLPCFLAALFCLVDKTFLSFTDVDTERPPLEYSFHSLSPKRSIDSFVRASGIRGFEDGYRVLSSAMKSDGLNVHTFDDSVDIDEFLLAQAEKDENIFKERWTMGASNEVEKQEDGTEWSGAVLWFNAEPFHYGAAALCRWHTAVLKQLIPGSSDASVIVRNQPLGNDEDTDYSSVLIVVRFLAFLPMSLMTAFLTCYLIVFPIQERTSKAKLVQMMSGVHGSTYFGASFAFDFVILAMSSFLVTMAFIALDPGGTFTRFSETWVAIWTLLCAYGVTMMVVSYVLSYMFESHVGGMMTMISATSIGGGLLVLSMSVAEVFAIIYGASTTTSTVITLLGFLPPFAAVWGMINIHVNAISKDVCDRTSEDTRIQYCTTAYKILFKACCHPCPDKNSTESDPAYCFAHESPFRMDARNGIGYQLWSLALVTILALVVLIMVEARLCGFVQVLIQLIPDRFRVSKGPAAVGKETDADVEAERRRVDKIISRNRHQNFAIFAHNLTKNYGVFKRFRAVDNVSFAVGHHECFGLLGVNGAGKSTIFGMLTGDLVMSKGNAYIGFCSVRNSLREYQQNIGYCPQYDALLDTLSGREMLELFCALRGVPPRQKESIVAAMTALADLENDVDKPTITYSGGNKRKLSVALAMVGNPPVIFLDEPTAGIDPDARRKIWATLSKAQRDLGTAIILTSHSMDECESLCGRIAIMVNGSFQCLGSTQHLKAKFGQGFTVITKMKTSDPTGKMTAKLTAAMKSLFKDKVDVKDSHQCLLHFHVTDTDLRWSDLFEKVETLKKKFDLEDVVVSDTSLEQVFLSFARMQISYDESEPLSSGTSKETLAKATRPPSSAKGKSSDREDSMQDKSSSSSTIEP